MRRLQLAFRPLHKDDLLIVISSAFFSLKYFSNFRNGISSNFSWTTAS